jgi:energy-coupling factor transport system ATP-binding protein
MHSTTRTGPLRPAELAEAVVLADLSLALTVVGQVVPFGGALLVAAVVPLAVVGSRHRLRAVVAGAIAAGMVGFLVIGTAAPTMSGARRSALVGAADWRGWGGAARWSLASSCCGRRSRCSSTSSCGRSPTCASSRSTTSARGAAVPVLDNIGPRAWRRRAIAVSWMVRNWWMSVPILLFFLVIVGIWLTHGLSAVTLRACARSARPRPPRRRKSPSLRTKPRAASVALHDVEFRYPSAQADAAGFHCASNRARWSRSSAAMGRKVDARADLAGRHEPTGGASSGRARSASARRGHGFYRGPQRDHHLRERAEIRGLPRGSRVDDDGDLSAVGLAALADRDTVTLSGGQLQRLAVAAALARAPQLLVSDESTAMVDVEGRGRLVTLLRDLAREGVGVVHVSRGDRGRCRRSHDRPRRGRVIAEPRQARPTARMPTGARRDARPHMGVRACPDRAARVGHVYSRRTPWANRAGRRRPRDQPGRVVARRRPQRVGQVDARVDPRGLVVPSEGEALIKGGTTRCHGRRSEGRAADEQIAAHIGRVGLAFQPRLQLLRPVVVDEVSVAAGVSTWTGAARCSMSGSRRARRSADRRAEWRADAPGGPGVGAGRPAARLVLDEPFAGLDAEGRATSRGCSCGCATSTTSRS